MFRRFSKIHSLGVAVYSSLLHPRPIFSPINPSFTRNIATNTTNCPPSFGLPNMLDPKSLMTNLDSENFNYTTGRFLTNETYHLSQRRRVFDIPGLFEIIAKAMRCKMEQITGFRKLAEDVSAPLWYGRREHLDVFRGPYKNAESLMFTGAKKELLYLDKYGAPRMPYRHFTRHYYNYEKQSPSEHIKNLNRYLLLAPSLLPDSDSLSAFCIRHPDLTDSNIRISRDSGCLEVLSFLDWQNTTVLPLFLQTGIPDFIQNAEDDVSRRMITPTLPENFDTLTQEDKDWEKELLRRRLVHYHYNLSTAVYNKFHHKGLVDLLNPLRRRIFNHASAPWEGETIKLLQAIIDVVGEWEAFSTDGKPSPVDFTEEELEKAFNLSQDLVSAELAERTLMTTVGFAAETWVPVAQYEVAKALGEELKQCTLEASTPEERAYVEANWPLNDMNEDELNEYN